MIRLHVALHFVCIDFDRSRRRHRRRLTTPFGMIRLHVVLHFVCIDFDRSRRRRRRRRFHDTI